MQDERQGGIGIAELARRAGVTPRTIRYYVTEGLLPAPAGQGQRRAYGQAHLDRLEAIRELKAAYLPLHEIRRRLSDDLIPGGRGELRSDPRGAVQSGGRSGSKVESPGRRGDAGRLGGSVERIGAGDVGRSGDLPDLPTSPAAPPSATRPIGFGQSQGVGRIEIYEPTETAWRRHVLAPGVELHVRETDDPTLAEAIQRLLREAAAILDGTSGR